MDWTDSSAAQAPEPTPSNEPVQEDTIAPDERSKVKQLTEEVRASRAKWAPAFEGMRADARFHYGIQWAGQRSIYKETRYIANLVQQIVRKKVDALYPKDPEFYSERKPKMDFVIWDEDMATLQQVEQRVAAGIITPEDMALVQDVMEGMAERKMFDRVGRTMEIMFKHYIAEQTPAFKVQMKRYARRSVITGVSYVKLGFQRMEQTSEIRESRIADARERVARLERLMEEAQDPDWNPECAEMAEAKAMLQEAMAMPPIMREGPVFDFPLPWTIIPDAETTAINGWVGSRFIAEESLWPRSRIKEKFKVNVGTAYRPYVSRASDGDNGSLVEDEKFWDYLKLQGSSAKDDPLVCWWYVYDKRSGLVYTIADGYAGYLAPPRTPDVNLEQFFPYYPFMTNDCEAPGEIFPPSDVRVLRSMQEEYNRKREAVRQHRIANRPLYALAGELADNEDVKVLTSDYADHSIVRLSMLKEGMKVSDVFQMVVKQPVDPMLYETETDYQDMQRTSGSTSPVIGETQGATATENSIADASRTISAESNVDDFDSMMNALGRDVGILMLREVSFDTVQRIAGRGAQWPTLDGANGMHLSDEIFLKVTGGSSGRADRAQRVAAIERMSTLLVQIPGLKGEFLARRALNAMDPDMDLTDAFDTSLPSITALNAMAGKAGGQVATGDPGSDPEAQGGAGGDNGVKGGGRPTGSQPQFPAPTMAPV